MDAYIVDEEVIPLYHHSLALSFYVNFSFRNSIIPFLLRCFMSLKRTHRWDRTTPLRIKVVIYFDINVNLMSHNDDTFPYWTRFGGEIMNGTVFGGEKENSLDERN